MQNAELILQFCILHFAFCIRAKMKDDTLTKIDEVKSRLTSVRSYL